MAKNDCERLQEIEHELNEMRWRYVYDNRRIGWRLDTIVGKLQELQKILKAEQGG